MSNKQTVELDNASSMKCVLQYYICHNLENCTTQVTRFKSFQIDLVRTVPKLIHKTCSFRETTVEMNNKQGNSLVGDAINKAIDVLPFELHLSSYQYCGPGTN